MIIDFHTHVFPDKIAKNTVEALASKTNFTYYYSGDVLGLQKTIIDGNVHLAIALPVVTNPKQFDSINRFALEINEKHRLGELNVLSFAGIHPRCEDLQSKMQFIKEQGFKGVKIHPDYQDTFIDDQGYIEILRCAKDLDLIVVTHAGVDEGFPDKPVRCTPERIRKVVEKVGHNKLVLAHFGANKMWQEVLDSIAGLDLYLDTAFTLNHIDQELFNKIVDKHGQDKILFATDAPWQDVLDNVKKLKSFGLENQVLDKILYRNAQKLLGIEP